VHELTVRIERTEVQQAVLAAQSSVRNAQARLDLVQRQQKAGAATDLDVLKAQVEVKMQELELQKLLKRLQSIR